MEKFPTFSDDLKCELKWLEEHKNIKDEKISGIKQQKFLLFYNLFLETSEGKGNFEGLCAWQNGPVYTQVHAAVKHHYTIGEIIKSIKKPVVIDEVLANISKFIVELLSDEEVSEVTHKFDFWKKVVNEDATNISINDITKEDINKIKKIMNTYDLEFILNHKIYKAKKCVFFIESDKYDFVVENMAKQLDEISNPKPIKLIINNNVIEETIKMKKISI